MLTLTNARLHAQMIVFYYFSPRVTRSVVYGPRPRNTLDIYLPRHHMRDLQDPIPVVIYITGARPRHPAAAPRLRRDLLVARHCCLCGWLCSVLLDWFDANPSMVTPHRSGTCAMSPCDYRCLPLLSFDTCYDRRCVDHRLQGMGFAAGAPPQSLWRHRVLPGLPELPAGASRGA